MKKLFIYKTTELWSIPPEEIVYIKAEGNYSYITLYGNLRLGKKDSIHSSFQLDHIEDILTAQLKVEGITGIKFVRIGESVIVNCSYIHCINPSKGKLILSDAKTFFINLVDEIDSRKEEKAKEEKKQKIFSTELLSEFKNNLESKLPYEVITIMQEESKDKREKIIKKLYER